MPGGDALALARAEHELQLLLRRPAVHAAFDERGAEIVKAAVMMTMKRVNSKRKMFRDQLEP